jgi:general secretion pathway protein J
VSSNTRGFTLIEMMVVLVIMGFFTLMAYGGFRQFQFNAQSAQAASTRLSDLQMAMRRMETDLLQSAPRPVRDPLGDNYRPAFLGDMSQQYGMELTRGGWSNPLGLARSTQERVAYFLEEDRLVRRHWLVLDATLAIEPLDSVILTGVSRFEVRFLTGAREWVPRWPVPGATGISGIRERPLAVEITIDVDGFGRLVRLLEVRG